MLKKDNGVSMSKLGELMVCDTGKNYVLFAPKVAVILSSTDLDDIRKGNSSLGTQLANL